MFDHGKGHGGWGKRVVVPLVTCLMPLALSGCSTVLDGVAAVFGPGDVGNVVDAHVVYRIRSDCPTLLARTISHGYTVLTPGGAPEGVDAPPPLLRMPVEETGVFEGPVRTGEVVFRYIPPEASETWEAGPIDLVAEVDAVRLDLEAGSERIVELCGPLPETLTPDASIPRIPGR